MKVWKDASERVRWFLTILFITLGVYLSFRYLLPLILPFLVAYLLAWIIRPVTELLYRRLKIPRIVGGTFSLLLLVVVFGTSICLLINILIKQTIAFIKNLPIFLQMVTEKLDHICVNCDKLFGLNSGSVKTLVEENLLQTVNRVKSNLMPKLTEQTIAIIVILIAFIGILLIIFVSAVLIVKDIHVFKEKYENNDLYQDIHKITVKLTEVGMAYLRSQIIIMLTVAGICVLGLILIGNDYALLLGIGIAFMDALPILGSGIVFVPWAIILLMKGNIYGAAILITTYLLCQVVREVLEPKLIGNRIGIKPIFTLVSMYVGFKLFSVAGFFLGPIGLVIIITIYKVMKEKKPNVANQSEISYNEE